MQGNHMYDYAKFGSSRCSRCSGGNIRVKNFDDLRELISEYNLKLSAKDIKEIIRDGEIPCPECRDGWVSWRE